MLIFVVLDHDFGSIWIMIGSMNFGVSGLSLARFVAKMCGKCAENYVILHFGHIQPHKNTA
jgi:uncharacterized membrane protein YuzA (DUF378 family)